MNCQKSCQCQSSVLHQDIIVIIVIIVVSNCRPCRLQGKIMKAGDHFKSKNMVKCTRMREIASTSFKMIGLGLTLNKHWTAEYNLAMQG